MYIDSTAVPIAIHLPTDPALLVDGIRVLATNLFLLAQHQRAP